MRPEILWRRRKVPEEGGKVPEGRKVPEEGRRVSKKHEGRYSW